MKNTTITTALLALALLLFRPSNADAADNWQERMLFEPTPAQLQVEKSRDRIMIYAGLKDVQVAQAMEEQFDRIEHMMFVGTVVTDSRGESVVDPDTGEVKVEDDGC